MGSGHASSLANRGSKALPSRKNYKCVFTLVPDRPDVYSNHRRFDKFRDLREVTYPVNAVAIAEVALILAAATLGNGDEVQLWSLMPRELKVSLHAHSAHVWALEFSPNESVLATASNDHTIRLWNTYSGACLGVLKEHTQGVRTLAFSSSGYLISGGMDSMLCLWEYDNVTPVQKWKAHEGDVHGVAFSLVDPHLALSVGADGSIALWSVMYGEDGLCGRFPGGEGGGVLCVATHPLELGVVAAGNQDGSSWLWSFEAGAEGTARATGHVNLKGHKGPVWSVEFSKDGCLLASGSSDGNIRVWDVTQLQRPVLAAVFRAHDSWVRQVHFQGPFHSVHLGASGEVAKDKLNLLHTICSCSIDGTIRMWAAPRKLQELRPLQLPSAPRLAYEGLQRAPFPGEPPASQVEEAEALPQAATPVEPQAPLQPEAPSGASALAAASPGPAAALGAPAASWAHLPRGPPPRGPPPPGIRPPPPRAPQRTLLPPHPPLRGGGPGGRASLLPPPLPPPPPYPRPPRPPA